MWHIKDMDKKTPTLNTEVGTGSIDFVKIFKYHTLAGEQETFMEQENYAAGMDPYTSIAQSAAYIKNKLLV
jgi:sugar phosphate isomerase/epimerase